MIKIYEHKPENFNVQVEIAACYLEINKKILMLQRLIGKQEPETWGVPAGKIEKNETPLKGALRELFEETGIVVIPQNAVVVGTLYMRKPNVEYAYHIFKVIIDQMPPVILEPKEHQAYAWVTLEELKTMNLMGGAYEALLYYYEHTV